MSARPPSNGPRASPERPALVLEGVQKSFGDRAVLAGADLEIWSGEVVVVVGRSGSGKSTLVHVAAGLEEPHAGRVEVDGASLAGMDPLERAEFRLRHVGIVFQHFNLIGDLTVLENVTLPLRLAHVRRKERDQRGNALLARFGVEALADRFPEGLSGGELQRVAVARALGMKPALVLADEPTANLDALNARSVVAALRTAAKSGAGVLVASHDPIVATAADRRFRFEDGRLAKDKAALSRDETTLAAA